MGREESKKPFEISRPFRPHLDAAVDPQPAGLGLGMRAFLASPQARSVRGWNRIHEKARVGTLL